MRIFNAFGLDVRVGWHDLRTAFVVAWQWRGKRRAKMFRFRGFNL